MWTRLVALSVALVALSVAGCSAAPVGTPRSLPPRPAPPVEMPYAPPPPDTLPAFHTECHAFTREPTGTGRRKIFDFEAISIAPVRTGPRVSERPRLGAGRTT